MRIETAFKKLGPQYGLNWDREEHCDALDATLWEIQGGPVYQALRAGSLEAVVILLNMVGRKVRAGEMMRGMIAAMTQGEGRA